MGIPEYEAKRYEGLVKNGGILLSAHVDDNAWRDKAKRILENTGAKDVSAEHEVSEESRLSFKDKKFGSGPDKDTLRKAEEWKP